jgi:hypothetical protein
LENNRVGREKTSRELYKSFATFAKRDYNDQKLLEHLRHALGPNLLLDLKYDPAT